MADQGDKNVTGMENIITTPGQPPVSHFVSGLDECEKKTVVWEIRNLLELLKMSEEEMKKNGISFDAGHSIGIPATWYFYLTRLGSSTGLHAILKLDTDSKAKHVTAGYSISVSVGGKEVRCDDTDLVEFKNTDTEEVEVGLTRPILEDSDVLEKTEKGKKTLKVTLIVNVFSNEDPVKIPKARVLKKGEVIADLGKLLKSGDGADIEVKVPKEVGGKVDEDSYTMKVHKGILMGRSTVFAKMFGKESEMVEAKTGKVVIKDLSPKGLDIFLHYIYTGKVSEEWVKVPEEILNASEKYDLETLKQYCGRNLMSAVTTSNAWEMFQLAKLHKLSFAKRAIAEFVSKNSRAVLEDGDDPSEEEDEEEGIE